MKQDEINAVKKALAKPEQDSTCSITLRLQGKPYPRTCKKCGLGPCIAQPTAQRTWVKLEGEKIRNLWEEATKPNRSTMTIVTSFARAIEAELKELNDHGI